MAWSAAVEAEGTIMIPRRTEVYQLECLACGREVEMEASMVRRDGAGSCPECDALLAIEWRVGQ